MRERKTRTPQTPEEVFSRTTLAFYDLELAHERAAQRIVADQAEALASLNGAFPAIQAEVSKGVRAPVFLIRFQTPRFRNPTTLFVDPEGEIFQCGVLDDGTPQLYRKYPNPLVIDKVVMAQDASRAIRDAYENYSASPTPQAPVGNVA